MISYELKGCDLVALEVTGAVIIKDNKIFSAQRPSNKSLGGLWEFPGGKVETGERPKEALKREIEEELSCEIRVHDFITRTVYAYDFGDIALSTYYCTLVDSTPILNEHSDMKWLSLDNIDSVKWAPADEETLNILKTTDFNDLEFLR